MPDAFYIHLCNLSLYASCVKRHFTGRSPHRDKTIHNPLPPGLFEVDLKLVALDLGNLAVAEFLVEYALAHG